jgi:hypothetical protein
MKNNLLFVSLVTLFATSAFASPAQPGDPLSAIQSLGAQVKSASEHAKFGKQPEKKTLDDFERTLLRLRDSAGANAQLQHKYQAIAMLFGNLKHQAEHPAHTPAKQPTRADIDIQVVTDQHGASCANALGIGDKVPVQVMLGQPGNGRSDAWFRYEPRAGAGAHFTTDSAGPDPALEVFDGCGSKAAKLASNDDALGLDAALSVKTGRDPIYVHLTNSGQAGGALVAASVATSSVSGTVQDLKNGSAIANAQVILLDSSGFYTGYYAYTDLNGDYAIDVDTAGDYYARADAGYSYLPELYPTGMCPAGTSGISGCDLAHAHTIAIASGATIPNVDFALDAGRRISGVVRNSSNQPLKQAVVVLSEGSSFGVTTYADDFGRYAFSTLLAGTYKVQATASGYGWQMFNHVACSGPLQAQCDLDQAASLLVSSQDITAIDFDLPQLAAIQGTVTDASSTPLSYAQVDVVDANGNIVAQGYSDSSGHYIAGPIPVGNYRAYASDNGYFSQLFDGIDCASNCSAELSSATPIAIATDGQQGQADFHLTNLPAVHGHVQDATSGLPLANVSILVSILPPATFQTANTAVTDANGDYTLTATPPGTYYVWALSDDHIDQVYPGIACENFLYYPSAICDVSGATLLTIALGQTPSDFDFALTASSSIGGQATSRGSDLPASMSVSIYDTTGSLVAQTGTDATGAYVVDDLPPGTYFAASTSYSGQYIEQLWQHIDCINPCAPTTGTQIPVAASTTVQGVDFDPIRLDAIVGRVANTTAGPVSYAVVDIFDAADDSYWGSAVVDTQGYYAVSGNMGHSYFVATEAGEGYVDQIYNGISCPLGPAFFGSCAFTTATAISLNNNATQPHIVDFVLQSNDPIFANGFE